MAVKQSFLAFLAAVKAWFVALGTHTEDLLIDLHQRIVGALSHAWQAVETVFQHAWGAVAGFCKHAALAVWHVVLVPVDFLKWGWGCVKASYVVLRAVWKR